MIWKIVSLFGVVLSVQGEASHAISEQKVLIHHHEHNDGPVTHIGHKKSEHHEAYATSYPSYEFSYNISDPDTEDVKGQHEARDGDKVNGQYWLLQPNGYKRTVNYVANNHQGFKAKVRYNFQKENKFATHNNAKEQSNHINKHFKQKQHEESHQHLANTQTTNDESAKQLNDLNIVVKESKNEETGSNSKNIGSSESKSKEETNNNSDEKFRSKSKHCIFHKYSNEDVKNEGSNEEIVSVPISSNNMQIKPQNSYQVTEQTESDENENQGEMEKQEKISYKNNESDKRTNDLQTATQERKTNIKGHGNINKSNKPDKQIGRTWNHGIIQNDESSSDEPKKNTYHHINGKILESYDKGKTINILSKNSNNAKSKNANGFTDERDSIKSHTRSREVLRTSNHVHQNDIENIRSQEENNYKTEDNAGKIEYVSKESSTESKSKLQRNEGSSKSKVLENNHFATRSKTHLHFSNKPKTEKFIINYKEEESKTRVKDNNINTEKYSNIEKDNFDSNTHISNKYDDQNQYFNLNRRDEQTSDEIFEHHILIHHPLFKHQNQNRSR